MIETLKIENISAFVFDFDGVLTDNLVHVSESGRELVTCNRSDGLAFDVLNKLGIPVFILSSERNRVVSKRAEKLKITAIQSVENKAKELKKLIVDNGWKTNNVVYIGNDLNDYMPMISGVIAVCPSDSHAEIKKISQIVLCSAGGKGVVRELVENVLGINILSILFQGED